MQRRLLGSATLADASANGAAQDAFRDLSIYAGVQGFKDPIDLGENGDFGFHEGANWGMPLWGCSGVGVQMGFEFDHSDLAPNATVFGDHRNQYFMTGGLFYRPTRECGWQGGIVWDYLDDEFYDSVKVGQIRGNLSYVIDWSEVGFEFAAGVHSDTTSTIPFDTGIGTIYRPVDLYTLYYGRRLCNGGEFKIYAGVANGIGRNRRRKSRYRHQRFVFAARRLFLHHRRPCAGRTDPRRIGESGVQPGLASRLPRSRHVRQRLPAAVQRRRQQQLHRESPHAAVSRLGRSRRKLALNCVGLLASLLLLPFEISQDGFARLFGLLLSPPLLLLLLLIGGLPALIYSLNNRDCLSKRQLAIPLAIAGAAIGLSAIGIVCSLVLPHHSAC